MDKETFLQTIPEDNSDWCAQQLLMNCDRAQLWAIQKAFDEFKQVCFKSWVKQMTFEEVQTGIAKAVIIDLSGQKEK